MRWKQHLTSTCPHLPTTFDHLLRPLGNATRANGIAHLHRGNLAGALIERRSKSGLRRNLRSGRGCQSWIFTFWAFLAIALFRSGIDGFHFGVSLPYEPDFPASHSFLDFFFWAIGRDRWPSYHHGAIQTLASNEFMCTKPRNETAMRIV
jgi:hypothetical protein